MNKEFKVFLGGTCFGWKWRDELCSLLKCDYYNQIVKNWSEEDRLREVDERKKSNYILYGITNDIKGVYSIAEVVDDSNKYPEKTIFLNLYKENKNDFDEQINNSLKAVENLLKENGVICFDNIQDAADYLNYQYIKSFIVHEDICSNDFFDRIDEAFVCPDGTWCFTEEDAIKKVKEILEEGE